MRLNFLRFPVSRRRLVQTASQTLALFFILGSSSAWAALGASVTLASGQPTDIFPGETTELQITLSNSDTLAPITGVGFSNSLPGTLPNGLKIAGAMTVNCTDPAGPSTAPGVGTVTAITGTQAISLAGEVIPARANNTDGTCTIIIPVTAGTSTGNATTYTYNLASGAVSGDDNGTTVFNSGLVNQSVNIKALAKPTIAKSFTFSTIILGGNSTPLRITLSNSNSVPITNVSLNDTFPTNAGGALIQVATTPGASNTCGGTFAPLSGDVALSLTGGTIPASGSCQLIVSVIGRQTNNAYSVTGTNTISATSDFGNDMGIAAAGNATAPITVNSPLSVTKSFSPTSLASGQNGSVTITLTNSGTSPLTITTFDDSPIDGIGNADGSRGLLVTGVGNTCGGTASILQVSGIDRGVRLTGGSISGGSSCTVTANFTATTQADNTPVTYTNTIGLGAVGLNETGIVSLNVTASILVADTLRVLKTNSASAPRPGSPARYTITVQNWSSSAMSNVRIQETLPNGMTFVTGTINGNDYSPTSSCSLSTSNVTNDTNLTFTLATVAARSGDSSPGSCTVTFYTMTKTNAANGSSTVNTINAGSVCTDNGTGACNGGGVSSNNSTVNTTVLSAAKTFDGATSQTYAEGTVSTMRITLSNYSVNPLDSVSITDTLPLATIGTGQMRIANPANAASNCAGATVTAVAGSTSLAVNGAAVPARAASGGVIGAGAAGTCFVQVNVVGPAGTYNNTATLAGNQTYANGTTGVVSATTNTATLTYNSALSATKSFAPTAVSSGGKSTVTIRLANSGAVALGGVAVTDPLPSGMVLSTPPNAYTTCAGSTTVNAVAGAGSISMSGASIAGLGNCALVFDVTATGSANWVNTIPVGNITASGGVANQTAVVGTLNYQAPNNPSVSKQSNPSTLTFPGQVSQLTITVNSGSQAVTGLNLTDYFTLTGTSGGALNGMAVAPTPAAATTCAGGTVSAAPGATSVSLSGASMAANTSCTLTVNVTSTSVGGITNYIPVGSIRTDQGLSNTGQASTSLTTQSNIGVTKQFTPNVVTPGTRSRLRITFFNPTAQPGTNIAVTDNLPAGVTVPSGANPQTTCTGATVSSPVNTQVQVSGGSIAAASGGVSASCHAEIDVVAATQGDYVNTIAAGTVTATVGGTTASNSQPTSDTLRVKQPVVIHTAFSGKTLDAGNPVGFTTGSDSKAPGAAAVMTIRLDNANAADLTAAAFTDTLPTGLVVGTTPGASTTCTGGTVIAAASGTTVRLTGATIPASGSCTVTVNVLSNISGSYINTIASGDVSTYEGVSNTEGTSAKIDISTPPTVSKQFSPSVIAPNGVSTLTIVLGNSNTSAVTLSSAFVDTLPSAPGNIYIAAMPNVVKTCPGAVTVTATTGTTITYASGAQIPAGGCTISVNVTGATPGDHTNNIPAGTLVTNYGNNQQAANAVLTVSTMAYVSGRVFQDNNVTPNGTYESGTDLPLSGVSVELHSGADCSGALVSLSGLTNPATTDVLGNYMFAGLSAGTYSVCEPVQPTGTSNGITTAGGITFVNGSTGTAGTASNPTASTSQIANIVLNGDGASSSMSGTSGNNFAEIVLSSISGTVFQDQNNNGVKNGADTGIAGVTIELLDNSNAVLTTTTTDASGNYVFAGLAPGNYAVREQSQPSSTSNGITTAGAVANGGTAGSVTSVTTVPSVIGGTTKITLPPNTVASGNNFAEIPNGRSLSGRVFLDFNNNGVFNGPDHGIGLQTINLTGTDINGNAVSASTTTISAGTYSFTGLPEGTYTVTEPVQPAGTTNGITTAGSTGGTATTVGVTPSAISAISLVGANTVSADNNFADVPNAAADLTISKTHSPSSFGDGSSTGYFTITPGNIGTIATSGTITVVDTLPAGMTVAAAATGTGWACAGAVGATTVTCTSTDLIAAGGSGNAITLRVAVAGGLAGQILTNTAVISGGGEPAGFDSNNTATDPVVIATTATMSGTVWIDANHNLVLDAGETSAAALISGWQVELLLGGVQVASTTTAANGTYSLTGLAPGSGYTLRFRSPVTGTIWHSAVANEQGITPTNGVRDNTTAAVNGTNAGNPAGATISGDGTLSGMTLFADDNIVQQSLPLIPSGAIGIAKQINGNVSVAADGSSLIVPIRLVVTNVGNEPLHGVSVTDPLSSAVSGEFGGYVAGGASATLAGGQYTVQTAPSFSGACANGSTVAGYTGDSGNTSLATISAMAMTASCTIDFTYRFKPLTATTYTNQARADATSDYTGTAISDLSHNGSNPDPNGNGNAGDPGEDDPTPIPVPLVGIAKSAGAVVRLGDGTYTVPFTLTLRNMGQTALSNVQVTDAIAGALPQFGTYTSNAVPAAGEYTISSGPAVSGQTNGASLTAVAAGAFTGSGAGNDLLVASSSSLPNFGASPSSAQVTFTVRFFPTTAGPFNNSAVATASPPGGGTITDNSVDGSNPDANGNGDPTDDASPTVANLSGQYIGAAKAVGTIVQTAAKRFRIPYTLIVANTSTTVTATNVQLSDNLSAAFPTAQSITLSTPAAVSGCTGTVLTIASPAYTGIGQNNLLSGNLNLQPGERCTVTFTAEVDFGSNALPSAVQNNQATVTTSQSAGGTIITTDLSDNGSDPDANGNGNPGETGENDPTPVSFASGNLAAISGKVYQDSDHDRTDNDGTPTSRVNGFVVEVLNAANQIVGTASTDSSGSYTVYGLFPSTTGDTNTYYSLRFREPASGAIYGIPQSADPTAARNGVIADGIVTQLQLASGVTTINQSLPLDPSGVVYDSVTRAAVSGAQVTLSSGGAAVAGTCLVGGVNPQTTGASGQYQFLLINPVPPGCPGAAVYTLHVTQPGGYLPPDSIMIPPTAGPYTPTTGGVDAIQAQAGAPTGTQPTTYYTSFDLAPGTSSGVVNNHIAIDPILGGAITMVKKTPLVNVSRGDLVPYTLTATNTLTATLSNIDVRDQLPPGFKYKVGTASVDGVAVEPTISGRVLTWPNLTFTAAQSRVIRLTTVVGSGVSEGTYVNQAYALNNIVSAAVSNTATATVRVVPDPAFDCSDVIGKVFDDKNINGYQDAGEPGIANVRLATVNGLLVTTDAQGRYHVACAMVPNEDHGSNFLMKLDERTLPTGFRVTTENPRDVRLTRGKVSKLNFGATIHRVVRLDVNDAAYASGELKAEWKAKLEQMPELLKQQPSVLRLAYKVGADGEDAARKRLKALSKEMREKWKAKDCCHLLQIEEELIQPSAAKREGR